jgi:hypothetical protein
VAIARKPSKALEISNDVPDEKAIETLINKGGSSIQKKTESKVSQDEDLLKSILLRVYQSQLDEVEEILQNIPKRQRPSRHAYIVKALEEKVQKDKAKLKR